MDQIDNFSHRITGLSLAPERQIAPAIANDARRVEPGLAVANDRSGICLVTTILTYTRASLLPTCGTKLVRPAKQRELSSVPSTPACEAKPCACAGGVDPCPLCHEVTWLPRN